jgi:hypothetical protein
MFHELVLSLSAEDRKKLNELGVPSSRVSEWINTNRLPTRGQTVALSIVKGVKLDALEKELTMLELVNDAKKNPKFQKVLKRLTSV